MTGAECGKLSLLLAVSHETTRILVAGYAYRLPGGIERDEDLWNTFIEKKCHIINVPESRFNPKIWCTTDGSYQTGKSVQVRQDPQADLTQVFVGELREFAEARENFPFNLNPLPSHFLSRARAVSSLALMSSTSNSSACRPRRRPFATPNSVLPLRWPTLQ